MANGVVRQSLMNAQLESKWHIEGANNFSWNTTSDEMVWTVLNKYVDVSVSPKGELFAS